VISTASLRLTGVHPVQNSIDVISYRKLGKIWMQSDLPSGNAKVYITGGLTNQIWKCLIIRIVFPEWPIEVRNMLQNQILARIIAAMA
jgi:hypothetical protein